MIDNYTIFFVDDVEINRRIAESAFGSTYNVEVFDSGKACLERVGLKTPDLFLLDVDMPDMDGYTLCRHLKSLSIFADVPVIFISGLDDLESRLMGYDAGGSDFIVKPYKVAEIKQKIEVLRRIADERSSLRRRLDDSDSLSSLAMSNLDEYAVLMKFLRSLNRCQQVSEIADTLLAMMKIFSLEGALQIRLPTLNLTIDHLGEVSPLQASIIRHVRSLGAVAEFKSRAIFNFDRVSLLINNMPLNDPDLGGHLRDHLAIAVETADEKLLSLQTREEYARSRETIDAYLRKLKGTMSTISKKYDNARFFASEATQLMLEEIDLEFSSLGLPAENEEQIKRVVESRTDQLIGIYDFGAETEKALNDLADQLTAPG